MLKLAMIVGIFPVVAVAQPQEVATVLIQNEYAVLYDDGTWAYENPDLSITARPANGCLSSEESQLQFCPDDSAWANIVFQSSYGSHEQTMTTVDGRFTLSVSFDPNYGHGGELDYFEETSGGNLMRSLVERMLGLGEFTENIVVKDDTAIIVNRYADPDVGYLSFTLEVLRNDETLYAELASVLTSANPNLDATSGPQAAETDSITAQLFDDILVNGTSLSTFLEAVEQ